MQHVRPALMMMVLFTLLLGLGYPLAMTGVAGLIFPAQAGGSLVQDGAGHVVGSSLIAQGFAKPEYLHPRASAAGNGYDPMSSGGSQLGPLDQKLIDRVKTDSAAIRKDDGPGAIPADAVTISGSGLDPDISPENAQLQAARIAKARGMTQSETLALISAHTDGAFLGFIGQPHVNVLAVNRALDARYPVGHPKAS
jgi:K+-transporting ATPase ATPase C chain